MALEKWKQNSIFSFMIGPFHILTATLLTFLLPLSFLLLSRLSVANYLLSLPPSSQIESSSIPIFLFFNIIPTTLYPLVSLVSVLTLLHALTGQVTLITRLPRPIFKLPLCISWFFLCTFEVCVGLGIEGSVAVGINYSGFNNEISLLSRVVFFLGLHETMTYWSRTVVRPVVDDTIVGYGKRERWIERVALAAGLGGLWWWKLRNEVEILVITTAVKKELMMGVGIADVIGWWLYYLTVTIGIVKFGKLIMWFACILLFERVGTNHSSESPSDNDEKV